MHKSQILAHVADRYKPILLASSRTVGRKQFPLACLPRRSKDFFYRSSNHPMLSGGLRLTMLTEIAPNLALTDLTLLFEFNA